MKDNSELRRKMMMHFLMSLVSESEHKYSPQQSRDSNVIHLPNSQPEEKPRVTDTRFKALREKLASKQEEINNNDVVSVPSTDEG